MEIKTQGQLDYEADVLKAPTYPDGGTRKTWAQLGDVEQWSWNRKYVPFSEADACYCQPFDGPSHPQCPMCS